MSLKRYRYRAYPTGDQVKMLARTFGSVRVVFNDFITERDRLFREGLHKQVPMSQTARLVTTDAKTRTERAWLSQVSSVPLQQAVADAQLAYRNFFNSTTGKRAGPKMGTPNRKRRGHRQTARFTRNSRFQILDTPGSKWGKVRLPKVGDVKFARSRDLPSDPSSVTMIREPDGTYWVSFVVDVESPLNTPAATRRAAGVDLGLTHLASIVCSDGTREKVDNPRPLKAALRKLARQQRLLARKQKGSANRAKARVKVARTHRKVRDLRADHHHKLAGRLVAHNNHIALETLSLTGMSRTRLAKSVHDAGMGILIRYITEKAENQGRTVTRIGQWEPTTQTCSVCGTPGGKKPLHVRTWTCSGCGTQLDRDYNAAVNILVAAGLAETLNACGPGIRLRLAEAIGDETGTHRTNPVHDQAA